MPDCLAEKLPGEREAILIILVKDVAPGAVTVVMAGLLSPASPSFSRLAAVTWPRWRETILKSWPTTEAAFRPLLEPPGGPS